MWKQILKLSDSYKTLPHDVTGFTVDNVGSSWYIHAHFADRNKVAVGRYKTEAEARARLAVVENITNSNK